MPKLSSFLQACFALARVFNFIGHPKYVMPLFLYEKCEFAHPRGQRKVHISFFMCQQWLSKKFDWQTFTCHLVMSQTD